MLDAERSEGECGPYRVVSLIEPGPLVDKVRGVEVAHGLDDGPVDGGRLFTGADSDVVVTEIGQDETNLFNPDGSRFVYQAWVTLSHDQLAALQAADEPSWNVMQRGFADAPGGQWKMSLVVVDDEVQAQCVVRDQAGERLLVHSRFNFQPDLVTAISCLVDDLNNKLRIVVNEHAGDVDTAEATESFGDVAPRGSAASCWENAANQLAIGNKPLCGDGTLDEDDRFTGTIRQIRILKELA